MSCGVQLHEFAGAPGHGNHLISGSMMVDEEGLPTLANTQVGRLADQVGQLHQVVPAKTHRHAPVVVAE
jgi:hypothetical protein